jgi:hypothetical protein
MSSRVKESMVSAAKALASPLLATISVFIHSKSSRAWAESGQDVDGVADGHGSEQLQAPPGLHTRARRAGRQLVDEQEPAAWPIRYPLCVLAPWSRCGCVHGLSRSLLTLLRQRLLPARRSVACAAGARPADRQRPTAGLLQGVGWSTLGSFG